MTTCNQVLYVGTRYVDALDSTLVRLRVIYSDSEIIITVVIVDIGLSPYTIIFRRFYQTVRNRKQWVSP